MDASDMLDVIHYFFEEDFRYSTNEESIYKDEFRKSFYKKVYKYDYRYVSESETSDRAYRDFDADAMEEADAPQETIEPFNPRARKSSKAFIEATPIVGDESTPFGSILDGPIG
jgi:hypothetical protein